MGSIGQQFKVATKVIEVFFTEACVIDAHSEN